MTTAVRIQEAALARFAAQGYAATSMAEIAADAGIKKASLYTHCRGKRDLFQQLARAAVSTELAFASAQILRPAPVGEALRSMLESKRRRFADSASLRFWVRAILLPPPELAVEIRGYERIYHSGLSEALQVTLEKGLDAPEAKRNILVAAYLGIMKALYAELLQAGGGRNSSLEALWAVFQCAMAL